MGDEDPDVVKKMFDLARHMMIYQQTWNREVSAHFLRLPYEGKRSVARALYEKEESEEMARAEREEMIMKNGKETSPCVSKSTDTNPSDRTSGVLETMVVGDITDETDRVWRILTMRIRRQDDFLVTDYDVLRLAREWKVDGKVIKEKLPTNGNVYILRMCRSNDLDDQKDFMHEYNVIKHMRSSLKHERHRLHFPSILSLGKISELTYIEKQYNRVLPNPRPFYIVERLEATLELLQKSTRDSYHKTDVACFLAIGCLRALSILHREGFAHRNVQQSVFAVRLGPTGLLHRKDSELADCVALVELGTCYRYRSATKPYRHPAPFVGNRKYCSPEAHLGKEQTSVDDCISLMYMLYDMLIGSVPWCDEDKRGENIVQLKKEFEIMKKYETGTAERKSAVLVDNTNEMFSIIRCADGYMNPVNYDVLIEKLATQAHKHRDEKLDAYSIFGFHHYLIQSYRHGFEDRKGGPWLKNGEGAERPAHMLGRGVVLGGKRIFATEADGDEDASNANDGGRLL